MLKTSKKNSISKKVQKSGSGKKSAKAVKVAVDKTPIVEEPPAPVEALSSTSPALEPKAVRRRRSTNSTVIALEKLLAIVEELGLKTDEKKAWLRIDGPNGSRVYLPRRKHVGRVDIAKMSAPEGTSIKLGDRSFGAVAEQLDMEAPEDRVLENFRAVLKHMTSLPREEVAAKKGRTPKIMEEAATA